MKRIGSIGLRAWPYIRGVDANWRRLMGDIPVEPFERVFVAKGTQPGTTFHDFQEGYWTEGTPATIGIYFASKKKPVGLHAYVRMVSHSDDNPQGFTTLAIRGNILPGSCESFSRLDTGGDIQVRTVSGVHRRLSFGPYVIGSPETRTPALWASEGGVSFDANGYGVFRLDQQAAWDEWVPGYAGGGIHLYPNFPTMAGDDQLYWLSVRNLRSILAWGFDETFHPDRRTYLADLRTIYTSDAADTYTWTDPPPEGTIDWEGSTLRAYYDPAQSFTQGSSTYRDLSGGDRDLTFGGTPTYETDNGGRLTGSCYATRPAAALRNQRSATISAWVYVSASQNWVMALNGSGANGFGFGQGNASNWDGAGNNLWILFGNVAFMNAGAFTGLPGWKLITLTVDANGKAKIFINGASFYSNTTYVAQTGSANFSIMGVTGAKWGIAAAWDSLLSDAQILANFNATKARYGL